MKLDSHWFDGIRSSRRRSSRGGYSAPDACEWPGCACTGGFRAPKGRHKEGQYHNFCQDHARQYNQSYNYFADMPEEKVEEYQKNAYTGHRPTWTMGVKGQQKRANLNNNDSFNPETHNFRDPFGFFAGSRAQQRTEREEAREIRNVARQAFEQLGLDTSASPEQIKTQFKALAKRLHPDLNGGDRATEDKLRSVIQAYNYLKQNNYC